MEFFIAWYSGNLYERYAFLNRAFGPYKWAYWSMVSCNVLFPQLFWFKKVRTSIPAMFVLSIVVNIGMWFERFVIIVTSLHRDYIPSSWSYFRPSIWDIALFLGTFGLFLTMFLLFCKFLPVIALGEVKAITPPADPHPPHDDHGREDEAGPHAADPDHDEPRAAKEDEPPDVAKADDEGEDEPQPKAEPKPSAKKKKKKGSGSKSKKEDES